MTNGTGDRERPQTARPRIAAMERGPGPARYCLPSLTGSARHDATRRLYPCYSFGAKLSSAIFKKTIGPGPAHAIDPTITHKGKDGTPHYSLSSRHKELVPFNTPGPGTYAPEKKETCFQGEKQPPSYSIGGRSKYRRRDATPSPNTYTLPSLLGPRIPNRPSSACYSMAARQKLGGFDTDYAKTPGPAGYAVTDPDATQKKAPAYSILKRQFMPGDTTQKPGPGAHSPEKVNITKRAPPAYSLGIRHSEYLCPLIIEVAD